MAQQANLHAATRTQTGKGAARSLRREGKVPGVIYGHGRAAEAVTIETGALDKTLLGINAATTILDVVVDGRAPVKALIREMQRDPLRPAQILHLDLYEVRTDEQITLEVPVHLVGIPDGVRNFGGVLDHSLREVEIEVLPADIPERVELDVTALAIGHSVFVRDIQIPEGPYPQRSRHTGRDRRRPEDRGGSRLSWRSRPWRSPSSSGSRRLRRRAKARAKPSPRPDPARHRWAWESRQEYADTRHNAGFRLADHLAERWSSGTFRRAERSRQAEGTWEGHAVRVLKPQTYMNRSGAALAPLRALSDFDPANDLLILVDDVAIPLGTFRLRGAGSAGGHNGLKSIEGTLQRQDTLDSASGSDRCRRT